MKSAARAAAQLVLGVAIVALLLWWLAPDWSAVADAVEPAPALALVSFAGTVLATFVTAARWKLIAESMGGSPLPYGVYFHWLAVTRLIGQVLPTLAVDLIGRGAGLRTAGSRDGLVRAATPVVVERGLDIVMPIAMLAWALAVHVRLLQGAWIWVGLVATAIAFAAFGVVSLRPLARAVLWAYARARRLLKRGDAPPDPPHIPPPLAARVVGHSLLRWVGVVLQYWGAGAGVGVALAAVEILSAAPLAQLGGLLGVTPGGLGFMEGGWAAALGVLGRDSAQIVIFMAATRVAVVLNFAVLSALSLPWKRGA
jgi:uncharacterized membrane protein YbhN (UPF0104 family)